MKRLLIACILALSIGVSGQTTTPAVQVIISTELAERFIANTDTDEDRIQLRESIDFATKGLDPCRKAEGWTTPADCTEPAK